MPVRSRSQNRFFRWAEEHPEESGVKRSVSQEFVSSTHGQRVRDLPERVGGKASGGNVHIPRSTDVAQENDNGDYASPDWWYGMNRRLMPEDQAPNTDRGAVAKTPNPGDASMSWQGSHPSPDPKTFSYSHLPSDLKQRNMAPPQEPQGMAQGGFVRRPFKW